MDWKEAAEAETVCYCSSVNKKTIVDAIKDGNNSLKKIRSATGACTVGNCKQLNPSGKCCSADILTLISIYVEGSNDTSCSCCKCN